MWFSRFLTISARVCVCHVNLRQFILDSHFAHINMHVNVNAIALVYVCIVRPIFFFHGITFARATELNFFCHLLFLWYSIFCAARNFNCFSFSFIRCCSSSSGYITELQQQKQLETEKSRSLTRVFCFWIHFLCYLTRATVVCISIVAVFLSLSFNLEICIQMREHGTVSSCLLQSQSSILRFDCLLFCISNWFNKS